MKRDAVIKTIGEVVAELQTISGRECGAISEATCPIGDLDQFDSLNGVEATVELSDRLGFDLPGVNGFVNDPGTKALTVGEIADGICALAASGSVAND